MLIIGDECVVIGFAGLLASHPSAFIHFKKICNVMAANPVMIPNLPPCQLFLCDISVLCYVIWIFTANAGPANKGHWSYWKPLALSPLSGSALLCRHRRWPWHRYPHPSIPEHKKQEWRSRCHAPYNWFWYRYHLGRWDSRLLPHRFCN